MSRRTIIVVGLLILAVAAAVVFTMATGVRGNSAGKDAWMLTVTMPASNTATSSPQIKVSRPTN